MKFKKKKTKSNQDLSALPVIYGETGLKFTEV